MDMHAQDQAQGEQRDRAEAIARDVLAYYRVLASSDMPDDLRQALTKDFQSAWLHERVKPPINFVSGGAFPPDPPFGGIG